MPYTAVFDVDGTLVDTKYQHALAWLVGDQLVAHVAGDEIEKKHRSAIGEVDVPPRGRSARLTGVDAVGVSPLQDVWSVSKSLGHSITPCRPEPVRSSARWEVFALPGRASSRPFRRRSTLTRPATGRRLLRHFSARPRRRVGADRTRDAWQARPGARPRGRRCCAPRPPVGPGRLVTMTAPVSGATVDPVRVHPPTARPALHQPGEHVIARHSVRTLRGRTTPLHRDEVGFADQRGMGHDPGDRPLTRDRRLPRAGHAASVGSTPDVPCNAGSPGSPPPIAGSTPARCGADSAPGRPRTGTAHSARSIRGRSRRRCARRGARRTSTGRSAPWPGPGPADDTVVPTRRAPGSDVDLRPPAVPVRRPAAEEPALLDRLCGHRRHRPMT